jgi:hypothetical protein
MRPLARQQVLAHPVPALPAHAAPKDPVKALKATIVPGHGVRYTGSVTWKDGTDERGARDLKGAFQFGKTGYYSGGVIGGLLPEGKTWYKEKNRGMPDSWSQFINPAETKTLARLLKNGATRGDTVSGSITIKELKAVSTWVSAARIGNEHDSVKISYTLTLSSAGLVNRVTSTYALTEDGTIYTTTVDTRYTGWGSKVSIKAPAPSTVTTKIR